MNDATKEPAPGFPPRTGGNTIHPEPNSIPPRLQARPHRPLSRRELRELKLSKQLEDVLFVADTLAEILADDDAEDIPFNQGLALSCQLFAGSFEPEERP